MAGNGSTSTDAQFAGLQQRVFGLETSVGEIKTSVGTILNRMDTQSRTPWGTIFTAMSVVGAALVGYITIRIEPINHDMDRLTTIVEKMNDRFMPAPDIDTRFGSVSSRFDSLDKAIDKRLEVAGARRDDWQRTSEARTTENKNSIEKLRDGVVTRQEHEQHWENERNQFANEQREIDDVKRTLADLYSARDVLRDDHEAIRNLEMKVLGLKPAS